MLSKKVFLFVFICILGIKPLFAAPEAEVWQRTTAEFSIVKTKAKGLKTEGTVIGELLKHTNRSLWSLIEEDGNILSIVITYPASNQATPITQIGFYRTLDLAVQQELEAKGILWNPIKIKIVYLKTTPTTIRFILNGTLVKMPALITQTK